MKDFIKSFFPKSNSNSDLPPQNENAFVHENIGKSDKTVHLLKDFVDISFICEYFHVAEQCYISPQLHRYLIQPYESRYKKIVTDLCIDIEFHKRRFGQNPEKYGYRTKKTFHKGMYFQHRSVIRFDYAPWNYLDRCPLNPISVRACSLRFPLKGVDTDFMMIYGDEHKTHTFTL